MSSMNVDKGSSEFNWITYLQIFLVNSVRTCCRIYCTALISENSRTHSAQSETFPQFDLMMTISLPLSSLIITFLKDEGRLFKEIFCLSTKTHAISKKYKISMQGHLKGQPRSLAILRYLCSSTSSLHDIKSLTEMHYYTFELNAWCQPATRYVRVASRTRRKPVTSPLKLNC